MRSRIKLVQQFLTMISQKLGADNFFGWSRTSETRMLERREHTRSPSPKSFVYKHPLLRGLAGSAGTCCPLAALGVSASPERGMSHTLQVNKPEAAAVTPGLVLCASPPPGRTSLHSEWTLQL